jgi:hypothetical protein
VTILHAHRDHPSQRADGALVSPAHIGVYLDGKHVTDRRWIKVDVVQGVGLRYATDEDGEVIINPDSRKPETEFVLGKFELIELEA